MDSESHGMLLGFDLELFIRKIIKDIFGREIILYASI